MLQGVLQALYPPRCAACSAGLPDFATWLCVPCDATLMPVGSRRCDCCGLPGSPQGVCLACASRPPAFDRARAFGLYGGALEDVLRRFKFGDRPELARTLARTLEAVCVAEGFSPDLVIPVPLGPRRLRRRGYDQAWLLAKHLARRRGWRCRPRVLRRVVATAPQARLAAAVRERNVRGAFEASAPVTGLRLLVVDDVLTTGATATACARALRSAGARSVDVLTVARAC